MTKANATTTDITIKLLKEELTVPAFRNEGGLALHRDHARPGFWTITHVPSGLFVWARCARNRADAMVRFDALLALTDWNRPEEAIVSEPGLYDRIRELQRTPPTAPRRESKPRPPRRMTKRFKKNGEAIESPVWWEEGGLTVEGDPKEGLVIAHDPSRLRVAALPRGTSRARASRIAKAFLDLGKELGMDWSQKNPFPPSGAPKELWHMVEKVEKGLFPLDKC